MRTSSLKKQSQEQVGLVKMLKKNGNGNSGVEPASSHRCDLFCLDPLTFHREAVGDMVTLSRGCQHAARKGTTFKNGLVFSSRPLRVRERIRLRVEKSLSHWHGALRVGFTNVPPSSRSLPLPPMAIPDLNDRPGHWASPVHESLCQAGSELEFWVSRGGTIYLTDDNTRPICLLTGVDLSQPLWAMIDIYGQTCSIFLLGSKKRGLLYTRRSCPVAGHLTTPVDQGPKSSFSVGGDTDLKDKGGAVDCVVCMGRRARVTLPCGHRCLCRHCVSRIVREFGTCPLCRGEIRDGCHQLNVSR